MESYSNARSASSSSLMFVAIASAVSTAAAISVCGYWYHSRIVLNLHDDWSQKRHEERTGRIRAEVRLRTSLKEKQQLHNQGNESLEGEGASTKSSSMLLSPIGSVVSPYTKRMGTPRQGSLVPSGRGRIRFTCAPAALDGIEEYSHAWVIFEFHANTNVLENENNSKKQPTPRVKIRPPRAPTKVGTLASRSPHRPNPLGLSLVTIDWWDASLRELHITGLDLVNGTPVYDLKPYVPWDIPGYQGGAPAASMASADNPRRNETVLPPILRVPEWVAQDDELASVVFTPIAKDSLQLALCQGRLAPLYSLSPLSSGIDDIDAAQRTIQEILAQDPRSSHKGLKNNARGTTSNNAQNYSFVFGRCNVNFTVDNTTSTVTVQSIDNADFVAESYVDGIPLVREALLQDTETENSSLGS
jgi:tRNA-Thr(GGU) m(6)t(6)A37 methyltransferase TsaA